MSIRHLIPVFPIPDERRICNVDSSGFLDAEILVGDIESLLLAEAIPSVWN